MGKDSGGVCVWVMEAVMCRHKVLKLGERGCHTVGSIWIIESIGGGAGNLPWG